MGQKVLVYKTVQTIEEEQYYSCSDEVYNKLKNAKTEEEKWKIWNEFSVWDNELVGDHSENWTEEEIDYGTHHD